MQIECIPSQPLKKPQSKIYSQQRKKSQEDACIRKSTFFLSKHKHLNTILQGEDKNKDEFRKEKKSPLII